MPEPPVPESPDSTKNDEPAFGSTEWLTASLSKKLSDKPEQPGYALANTSEYLSLRKLYHRLWKPVARKTRFIWIDPEGFDQPEQKPLEPTEQK